VLERVTASVREHEMFLPGQVVLVCVSGGPDSVCLLESLVRLRRLFRVKLEVFHLDHRLRGDSPGDATYVKRLAQRHELPFHLREADSSPPRGSSVEAWARTQRMLAGADVASEIGAERIAEGHTLDDQAETLLIALVRGGSLEALGGIAPVLGPEVQPLLDVTRSEVTAACRSLGLRPRRDPTNSDKRLLRNAIRLEGLPALERATGRRLSATLARTADLIRRDERELSRRASMSFEEVAEDSAHGWDLDATALSSLPRAIASRVVRTALYRLGTLPSEEAIDAVLDLASGRPGRRRDLPERTRATRSAVTVHLSLSSPSASSLSPSRGRPRRRGEQEAM
jgi:tRNA(Ile)-lysidine synthase